MTKPKQNWVRPEEKEENSDGNSSETMTVGWRGRWGQLGLKLIGDEGGGAVGRGRMKGMRRGTCRRVSNIAASWEEDGGEWIPNFRHTLEGVKKRAVGGRARFNLREDILLDTPHPYACIMRHAHLQVATLFISKHRFEYCIVLDHCKLIYHIILNNFLYHLNRYLIF